MSASDVVVVRLADGEVARVTDDGLASSPRWGPDGIVFRHDRELWLVPEPGSEAVVLEVPRAERRYSVWFPVDWSADGGRLLLVTGCAHGCAEGAVFDLASRSMTRLGETGPVALSADGMRVLIQDRCDTGMPVAEPRPLTVVDVRGGLRLLPVVTTTCGASWSP